jgi:hypothetical protein
MGDMRTTVPAFIWIVVAVLVLRLAVCAGDREETVDMASPLRRLPLERQTTRT